MIEQKTAMLHLSVILGVCIPLGNIIVPYIYWKLNKDKTGDLFDTHACNLVNFQIVLSVLYFIYLVCYWSFFIAVLNGNGVEASSLSLKCLLVAILLLNVVYPIFIYIRIKLTNKTALYYPKTIKIIK